ncbi:MAG TPA: hypothetical protein VL096_06225, partial [Pirellulaceae bacterium]|nr:hypothetical protein [Pirellulaceae bacterium]
MAMLSLGSAAPVAAADAVAISKISIGLGEHFKVGHWTPVRIELENASDTPVAGQLVLTTADVDGLSTRYVTEEVIRLDKTAALWRYVKFGNGESDLTVEFVSDAGVTQRRVVRTTQQATALVSTSELIVAVGDRLGVEEALTLRSRSMKRPVSIVLLKSLSELPDHPAGLAAIDTLILPTSQVEWSQLPQQSSSVVRNWVARGGRLILSVGKQGAELFGEQGVLVGLAPGAFDRVFALQRSGAIEAYAGATQRLETGGKRVSIDMTLLRAPRGRIELAETGPGGESQPVVLNYPVGFGLVTLVTVDLDQPPLASWKGRPRFVAKLLAFH